MIQPLCMYTWCASQSYFLKYSLYITCLQSFLVFTYLMGYFQSLSYSTLLELVGLSGHFYRLYSSNHPLLCGFHWYDSLSRTLNFQIWRHSMADLPDFFLCSYLKFEVYATCPSYIKRLKDHITQKITRNWLGLITASHTGLSHKLKVLVRVRWMPPGTVISKFLC